MHRLVLCSTWPTAARPVRVLPIRATPHDAGSRSGRVAMAMHELGDSKSELANSPPADG